MLKQENHLTQLTLPNDFTDMTLKCLCPNSKRGALVRGKMLPTSDLSAVFGAERISF